MLTEDVLLVVALGTWWACSIFFSSGDGCHPLPGMFHFATQYFIDKIFSAFMPLLNSQ